MDFKLRRPCPHCPFRRDIEPFLSAERAEEIADALEHHTFACHETVHKAQPRDARGRFLPTETSHCAGVLIIMQRENRFGDLQQIAARLGLLELATLDMKAPTFNTLEEFVAANGGRGVRWYGRREGTDERGPRTRPTRRAPRTGAEG